MRLRYVRFVRRPTMPSPYGRFSLANSFFTGTTIFCPRCWLTLTTSCFRRTLGWTREPSFAFRHPRSKGLDSEGGIPHCKLMCQMENVSVRAWQYHICIEIIKLSTHSMRWLLSSSFLSSALPVSSLSSSCLRAASDGVSKTSSA